MVITGNFSLASSHETGPVLDGIAGESKRRSEKREIIMSTTIQIAALATAAIVIAAPAVAGQRIKFTLHSGLAGAFASSIDPVGAHVNAVQRAANNKLNAVSLPRCPGFGIDLDLPSRCWDHGL
jgi:hypothetical protein